MNRQDLKHLLMKQLSGRMRCEALCEAVTDYLEGQLGVWGWMRFQMHLGMCAGCRTYLRQMKQTIRLLGHLPESPVDPAVRDALLERFRHWRTQPSDRS